ncbi:unnamed protein product [Protopolystoma xenopodis]|uniref:Secreted protein n=1 Tax=Protopolystoma xenopodis TaxID=117903 RepID=A0A448X9J5_9PLAT|nr:unnamed protein product [Protopolystoma xenopodis]
MLVFTAFVLTFCTPGASACPARRRNVTSSDRTCRIFRSIFRAKTDLIAFPAIECLNHVNRQQTTRTNLPYPDDSSSPSSQSQDRAQLALPQQDSEQAN